MPIYRFRCEDGHETEDLVPMSTVSIPCPHVIERVHIETDVEVPCGKPAEKVVQTSMARPVGGPTPIFHRRQLR